MTAQTSTMETKTLQQIAKTIGILPEFFDNSGEQHIVPEQTLAHHLNALGFGADNIAGAEKTFNAFQTQAWQRHLPPVTVVKQSAGSPAIALTLPQSRAHIPLTWLLQEENGTTHQGEFTPESLSVSGSKEINEETWLQYRFALPVELPWGYHRLSLTVSTGEPLAETLLIVTPSGCYIPPGLKTPEGTWQRIWGPAVQLYAVRSKRNWGIGDFTDLANLVAWHAQSGANVIGINPLHALSLVHPQDASPYNPSNRLFLNVLYLDIERVPDYAECKEARRLVLTRSFQKRLERLRRQDMVDYAGVADIKRTVLEKLYQFFRTQHLAHNTQRAQAFQNFVHERGEALYHYALFEAIQERLHADDPGVWGWPVWPEAYQNPNSEAVSDFAKANQERIGFYQYLQWLADEQLERVGFLCLTQHLGVGLYMDLAVGQNLGGSEVWANPELFVRDVSVGTPPDAFSPEGQNWGLPPMNPYVLREQRYDPFIRTLRETMRYAGALRIDHFMALMRLFWIPRGESAQAGAYVLYPFEELLGILALESQRNRTVVIGEDLGTVPDEVREKMAEWDILSYKVFYFEKDEAGEFKRPEDYAQQALVTLSTQDLPTLKGFWEGQINVVKNRLGLLSSSELEELQLKELLLDRMRMLAALDNENLLPEGITRDPATVPVLTQELIRAIHQYLAKTPSIIQLFQFEDVLEQLDQVNLPGTTTEYPNWQRKLPVYLEDLPGDPRTTALYDILRQERADSREPADQPDRENRLPIRAEIPLATYRFQFNEQFTLQDAMALVPYLKRLGISHCYASPLLTARPGSTHGYDITDHDSLNPEIGTVEQFETFTRTLSEHGIGLILDIVPNHMGVGSDNHWWMDVLENGPASEYAHYFDINWSPIKDELQGKVLLPILGDQYGKILENEELQVQFDAAQGRFTLHYYEHFWPLNPGSYPLILNHRLETLRSRLGDEHSDFLDYQSIVTAFENLPARAITDPDRMAVRRREKTVNTRRLQELCQANPRITEFIHENLADFNRTRDNEMNLHRLHTLLEQQAYRLAYWRVASDEINYRRFFDINDLAGLRMEDPEVFWNTHHLILQWIWEGKVTGLRIDHPDGLFDPEAYFRRLQYEVWKLKGLDDIRFQQVTPGQLPLYILVEKILAPFERIPENWLVHGATGYKFANTLNGLFIDRSQESGFTETYEHFIGRTVNVLDIIYHCKILIMQTALSSELNVLTALLSRIAEKNLYHRDFTLNSLRTALMEVVASFPVYRTYVTPAGPSRKDQEYIGRAIRSAKRRSLAADLSVFDFIHSVLLMQPDPLQDEEYQRAVQHFAMKFQQFSGPVMAKGLEDTCFYRYNRLLSINEVGGEPGHFGTSVSGFHHQNQERLANMPHNMLNTSTHDSKRSEDVRARLNVLSEMPDLWSKYLQRWTRMNRGNKTELDGSPAPDANDEYLIYQTLLGFWPFETPDAETLESLADRLEQYVIKALREAKVYSSWINPNADYESACKRFIRALTTSPENNVFLESFVPFQQKIAFWGMLNALSQVLLKLTVPGVPDIYQGMEQWGFYLVDPDNRRPVDYARLQAGLDRLTPLMSQDEPLPATLLQEHLQSLLTHYPDGLLKQFITTTCLNLRQQYAELFLHGEYIPLELSGEEKEHAVAFIRKHKQQVILVVAPRLVYGLTHRKPVFPVGRSTWGNTAIKTAGVPRRGEWKNCFTGETFNNREHALPLAGLLGHFPWGLFVLQGD